MLKLFWADVSGLSLETDGLPLSDYRLRRLEKIKIPERKRQSLGAELLLLHGVKAVMPEAEAPFAISCGENGKPGFENIPLHFSLSHSEKYSACLVSDMHVGLDIEHEPEIRPRVVERFFTVDEQERILRSEDKGREFARIWTAKESVLKFLGTGLRKGLASVHIEDGFTAVVEPEHIRLSLIQCEISGLSVSVCTERPCIGIEIENVKLS